MEILEQSVSTLYTNDTNLLVQGTMKFLSTAVIFGSAVFHAVSSWASESSSLNKHVDAFIGQETPIALRELLCNIGPDGCHSQGVDPGLVIASPSTEDPDYFYTWTRDSGLVLKCLVDRFSNHYDANLQRHIEQYILAQAKIQGIASLSGSLADGTGLGEPKYEVNSTAFTGDWGRPQRDGPALRAIAMIAYANWLMDHGYKATAHSIIWPILRNDLDYVAQYWNETGFDLWEEINGSSFFTIVNQHRALVQGTTLGSLLGEESKSYAAIAPQILCFLQTFWMPESGYIDANINVDDGRTGLDANTILGSIHTFDPKLGCDSVTFQPCSDRALSNHKAVVDSFRWYSINKGIPGGKAIAVGRYATDVYFDGNPWYLNTLAAAELLYDAMHVWQSHGFITVTEVSQPFFQDLVPDTVLGTYHHWSAEYSTIFKAVREYADGFVAVVAKYTPRDGGLSEQFSKVNGTALSAVDLTWSYAAFLTCAERRAGVMPPHWADGSATSVPSQCVATSVVGSYTSVSPTSFPPSQTPWR